MAATKPAPLCTLVMPSGKRCGSPALRGKPFCYHHVRKHRDYTRDLMLVLRFDRLGDQLDAMDTPQLLNFLHQKLATLTKTFRRFPEVGFTLVYTLDRIGEITSLESTLRLFLQQNQEFAARAQAIPNQSRNIPITSPESIS
jgi:hypothetical protein